MRHLKRHFIPHESNNYRALLIHPYALAFYVFGLIALQFSFLTVSHVQPQVLGISSQISPFDVINLTNQRRAEAGLSPLSVNDELTQAAQAKGGDMVSKNYWAHVSPDGKTPWFFITSSGYKYSTAGENLARDFSDAPSVVSAWMASKSHRENLLDPNFTEIGVAVLDSNIGGINGVLVVQEFGRPQKVVQVAKSPEPTPQPPAKSAQVLPSTANQTSQFAQTPTSPVQETPAPAAGQPVVANYRINPFTISRYVSAIVVGLVALLFIIDLLVVRAKGIIRYSQVNWTHLAALGFVMFVIWYVSSGAII